MSLVPFPRSYPIVNVHRLTVDVHIHIMYGLTQHITAKLGSGHDTTTIVHYPDINDHGLDMIMYIYNMINN